MRRRVVVLVVAALTVVGGCGSSPLQQRDDQRRPASFAASRVTWAQGSTVHYGSQTLHVAGKVTGLQRSPYGFVVERSSGYGPDDEGLGTVLLDGSGARPLPDTLSGVRISPDGRYAGWIDRRGPRRAFGRLAQAVVVDLATGEQVLTARQGMGGIKDDLDDLYEDAEPTFLGFDQKWAYWRPATGDMPIYRARIGTWEPEPGGRKDEGDEYQPLTQPFDAVTGRTTGMADDGRASSNGDGAIGHVSPDGRWCETDGTRLEVVECRTARVVTPRYPGQQVRFGGWDGADGFYAVVARGREDGTIDPPSTDRTTGVLARCSLRTRECTTLRHVRRLDSLVLPGGGDAL